MKAWQSVAIPTDENNLTEALGISKERKNELIDMMFVINEKYDLISTCLEELTGVATNINESIFLSFTFGSFVATRSVKSSSEIKSIITKFINEAETNDFFESLMRKLNEEDDD